MLISQLSKYIFHFLTPLLGYNKNIYFSVIKQAEKNPNMYQLQLCNIFCINDKYERVQIVFLTLFLSHLILYYPI